MCEMMQKLITEIGVVNGEVTTLKILDETVMELEEKLEGTRSDFTPMENGTETSRERQSIHDEKPCELPYPPSEYINRRRLSLEEINEKRFKVCRGPQT